MLYTMIRFIKKWIKHRNHDRFIKKKLNKKIRKRPESWMVFRAKKKLKRKIIIISTVSIAAAILVVCIVWRNYFFYNDSQRISEVNFSSWSISFHNYDQTLFETIGGDLLWTSQRANNWFGVWELVAKRTQAFPIIDSVAFEEFSQWVATIHINWHSPSLVFRLPWNRWYATYQENIFQINPESGIASSTWIIDLPRYTETFENINWIFRGVSELELTTLLQKIDTAIWYDMISEYIYLPWWKKLFIWYDSKRRYFHLNKDIDEQLRKLNAIQEFYTEYDTISVIDLGSTDNAIVQ